MLPLVLLVIAFAGIIYGAIALKWGMNEMSAVFLVYAVAADLLSGASANEMCKDLIDGSKQMLGAAFIIGMATAISNIMNDGKSPIPLSIAYPPCWKACRQLSLHLGW